MSENLSGRENISESNRIERIARRVRRRNVRDGVEAVLFVLLMLGMVLALP